MSQDQRLLAAPRVLLAHQAPCWLRLSPCIAGHPQKGQAAARGPRREAAAGKLGTQGGAPLRGSHLQACLPACLLAGPPFPHPAGALNALAERPAALLHPCSRTLPCCAAPSRSSGCICSARGSQRRQRTRRRPGAMSAAPCHPALGFQTCRGALQVLSHPLLPAACPPGGRLATLGVLGCCVCDAPRRVRQTGRRHLRRHLPL